MHLPSLAPNITPLLLTMTSYSRLRATTVKAIPYYPTAVTPTKNDLRSNLDFLPGRSFDMLAGSAPSTVLKNN